MTSLLQALLVARDLVADPATWTTGASARNEHRSPVSSMSADAVCFCAIGAIRRGCTADLDAGRVDYETEDTLNRLLNEEVLRQYRGGPLPGEDEDGLEGSLIIGVNDFKGHTATLAVFDAVIVRIRREQLIDALRSARALITDPKDWVQHVLARTSDGARTSPWLQDACRFCAGGALMRVAHENRELMETMSAVVERTSARLHPEIPLGYSPTVWVNDRFGHAAVLRVFDEAIASLRIASLRG